MIPPLFAVLIILPSFAGPTFAGANIEQSAASVRVDAAAQATPLATPTAEPSAARPAPTTATPAPNPASSNVPVSSPSGAAHATPGPGTVDAARVEFLAWQDHHLDYSRYVPSAREQLNAFTVAKISLQTLKPLGKLQTIVQTGETPYNGMIVHVYRVTCEKGAIDELISWDETGKISFFYFRPVH